MNKKIISGIIKIFFSFNLYLLMLIILFYITIFHQKNFLNILEKNNYYQDIYQSIKEDWNNYSTRIHIEDNPLHLENLISIDTVKKNINEIINQIYHDKKIEINTNKLEEDINNTINDKINENNITLTEEEQISLNKIKTELIETYKKKIVYSEKYINKIPKYYKIAKNISKLLILILSTINIITSIILLKISTNKKEKRTNIGISLMTVGFLSIMIYMICNHKLDYILIINKNITKLIIDITNNFINTQLKIGILLLIIGLFLSIKTKE